MQIKRKKFGEVARKKEKKKVYCTVRYKRTKDRQKKDYCLNPALQLYNHNLYVAREVGHILRQRPEQDELPLDWRETFTIGGAKWSRLTAIERTTSQNEDSGGGKVKVAQDRSE